MKNKNIFITATNTNIGKTYTTLKLLETFSKQNIKAVAFKPIETGVNEIAQDATKLYNKSKELNPNLLHDITLNDICPIQLKLPAAPFVAKGDKEIDFDKIFQAYKKLQQISDIVLIEGAGGLFVPIQKDLFMIDLIKMFDAKALLIVHNRLGCINDTLLSINALKQKEIKFEWCINHLHDIKEYEKITLPYFQAKFGKVLNIQQNLKEIANNLLSL